MEGYVYVLSNPAMPDLVKIGFTTQDDINVRLRELFSTGVPAPFSVEYACKLLDYRKVESALHRAFHPQRVHAKREFFNIEPDQAIAIMEIFEGMDITSDVITKDEATAEVSDREAKRKLKKRRPNIDYYEVGLVKGDVITYIPSIGEPEPITAVIFNNRKIEFQGEIMFLTAATQKIMQTTRPIQPGPQWTSEKGNLNDLYNATYSHDDY
jgi:hypothetical protein